MYKNIKNEKGVFVSRLRCCEAQAPQHSYGGAAPEYQLPPDIRGSRGRGGGPPKRGERELKKFIGPM